MEKPAPATWGGRRHWVRVLSLGLAKAKAGEAELAHRRNVRVVRQGGASSSRCQHVLVANPKGQAGKTIVSVVLAGKLAQIRGGGVVVWDGSDAAGTLASRGEGRQGRCVSEVANEPNSYARPGTIASVAVRQSSFADVIGSLDEDREFDAESVRRVLWALDQSYQVQVIDTGNVRHSPAFRAAVEAADLVVIPTTVTAGSIAKALALLRALQRDTNGKGADLAARAVVAITSYGGPETPGLAGQIEEVFRAAGVGAVVRLPYDPAIAVGTSITVGDLSQASDVAWTQLAAAVTHNLQH